MGKIRPEADALRLRAAHMIRAHAKPHVQWVPASADVVYRGRHFSGYAIFYSNGAAQVAPDIPTLIEREKEGRYVR